MYKAFECYKQIFRLSPLLWSSKSYMHGNKILSFFVRKHMQEELVILNIKMSEIYFKK